MSSDLRLAWLLLCGSDRREWIRMALTALGALLATGFALAAAALLSMRGFVVNYGTGIIGDPGTRPNVALALLALFIPIAGFLGQCARIGAAHRDRRLASLRLAGAPPRQVRRIAALESGLACLAGSVAGLVVFAALRAAFDPGRNAQHPLVWAAFGGLTLAIPALGVLVSLFALRRVAASPLTEVRRTRTAEGRNPMVTVLPIAAVGAVFAGIFTAVNPSSLGVPLMALAVVAASFAGAVAVTGGCARLLGRRLAASADAAVLIAAARLRTDPWAAARTHAAVLLVTTVCTAFAGIGLRLHAVVTAPGAYTDTHYYTSGIRLIGTGFLIALAVALSGLAVGTVEALTSRRRNLAAQHAAGVPRRVLRRAVFLETALPLLPAVLLAGAGGMAIQLGWGAMTGGMTAPQLLPLLVPVAVYAACLLAAATSLPLLRRAVHPAELRYA